MINIDIIRNDNYTVIYRNADIEAPNILLELYRGKLYNNLLQKFIKLCLTHFEADVFSNKKNSYRTLVNLLASWFFTLYSNCDFSFDAFFPNDYKHFDMLKDTINDYASLYTIEDLDNKINNIINELDLYYNELLILLATYKTSEFYHKNKNNITVTKKIITEKRDKLNVLFYKFDIIIKCPISFTNTRLKNIINNIVIPINEYNKLQNKYNGPDDMIDYYIWIIIYRYQLLGSNNNQLAVLPNILDNMHNDINLSFECFASAINNNTINFCSIYYDVEKYFGSLGSFFNCYFIKGVFSFNPPYQINIIENGIKKIFTELANTSHNLEFIVTIPIWDNEGKKYMLEHNSENNNNNIMYKDFSFMSEIFNSKFFKGKLLISKNDFTYIDHNFCLFKNKTIQNTYIIVLNNYNNNHFDIIKNYDFYSYNYDDIIIDI